MLTREKVQKIFLHLQFSLPHNDLVLLLHVRRIKGTKCLTQNAEIRRHASCCKSTTVAFISHLLNILHMPAPSQQLFVEVTLLRELLHVRLERMPVAQVSMLTSSEPSWVTRICSRPSNPSCTQRGQWQNKTEQNRKPEMFVVCTYDQRQVLEVLFIILRCFHNLCLTVWSKPNGVKPPPDHGPNQKADLGLTKRARIKWPWSGSFCLNATVRVSEIT